MWILGLHDLGLSGKRLAILGSGWVSFCRLADDTLICLLCLYSWLTISGITCFSFLRINCGALGKEISIRLSGKFYSVLAVGVALS